MWFGDISGSLVGIAFWAFVAAVILVPQYLRHMDRQKMYETMRVAVEKGQPLPPEIMKTLSTPGAVMEADIPPAERDLRRAIVLIAVGLGLAGLGWGLWWGLGWIPGDGGEIASGIVGGAVAGAGAIPGLIGVAYMILWLAKRGSPKAAS